MCLQAHPQRPLRVWVRVIVSSIEPLRCWVQASLRSRRNLAPVKATDAASLGDLATTTSATTSPRGSRSHGGKNKNNQKQNDAVPAIGEVPREAYWPREAFRRGPRDFVQATPKEETAVLDCFTGDPGEALQRRTLGFSCGRSRASRVRPSGAAAAALLSGPLWPYCTLLSPLLQRPSRASAAAHPLRPPQTKQKKQKRKKQILPPELKMHCRFPLPWLPPWSLGGRRLA